MSDLYTTEAKKRIATVIAAIEKKTAAEIVVALRPRSGDYRHADYLFGAIFALLVLCVFLYHPEEFDFTFFPIEQACAFVLGAVVCAHAPPLRRLFTRRSKRIANVEHAAKAGFVDMGIGKTRARTGIFVYLSSFEEDAALVLDSGIDRVQLDAAIGRAKADLQRAAAAGSLASFVRALEVFGEALASAHPVTADDVDELVNEVAA